MVSEAQKRATQKYKATHYGQVNVRLDKNLVDEFKATLANNGDTLAGWLKDRIVEYIQANK